MFNRCPLPPNQKEEEACKFIWGPGANDPFKFYAWEKKTEIPFSELNNGKDEQNIGTDYVFGKSVIYNPKLLTVGRHIWLEAFTDVPQLVNNYSLSGAYIVMVAEKPTVIIDLRRLHIHSTCEETQLNEDKDEYAYGEGVLLHIIMHSSTKNLSNDYLGITIESGSFKKTISLKNKLEKDPHSLGYNKLYSQYLHLSEDWKKKTEHEEGTKEYTITANWHSGVLQNYDNEAGEKYKRQQQSINYNPIDNTSNSVNIRKSVAKYQVDTQVIGKKTIKLVLEKPAEDTREWGEQIAKVGHTPEQTQCFERCHYTAITLTEALDKGEKRSVDLLKENKDGSLYNQTRKVFEIIAGTSKNKKKVEVILENLDTKKCLLKDNEKHSNTTTIIKQRIDDTITPIPHEIKGGKIDIEALSKMSNCWNIASPLPPIKYIWPKATDPVVYVLDLATCRYQREIVLEVYPDIKWTLLFEYACKNPIKYRDTWVKMRQPRVDDAWNKAQAGDIDGYDGDLETTFKLALGAAWDKETVTSDLSFEWEGKIKKVIGYFLKVKRIINDLVGGKTGKALQQLLPEEIKARIVATAAKIKRAPVMMEIFSPAISTEIVWQLANIKNLEDSNIVTEIEATLKFDPLIGGKGTLDLIACAEYIPAIQAIVTTVDTALHILGIDVTFAISLVGQFSVEGSTKFIYSSETGLKITEGEVKAIGEIGLEVELSAEGEWKVDTWFFEIDAKLSVGAKAFSKFHLNFGAGADEQGPYLDAHLDFDGVKIVLYVEGKLMNLGGKKRVDITIAKETPNILGGKYYLDGTSTT